MGLNQTVDEGAIVVAPTRGIAFTLEGDPFRSRVGERRSNGSCQASRPFARTTNVAFCDMRRGPDLAQPPQRILGHK